MKIFIYQADYCPFNEPKLLGSQQKIFFPSLPQFDEAQISTHLPLDLNEEGIFLIPAAWEEALQKLLQNKYPDVAWITQPQEPQKPEKEALGTDWDEISGPFYDHEVSVLSILQARIKEQPIVGEKPYLPAADCQPKKQKLLQPLLNVFLVIFGFFKYVLPILLLIVVELILVYQLNALTEIRVLQQKNDNQAVIQHITEHLEAAELAIQNKCLMTCRGGEKNTAIYQVKELLAIKSLNKTMADQRDRTANTILSRIIDRYANFYKRFGVNYTCGKLNEIYAFIDKQKFASKYLIESNKLWQQNKCVKKKVFKLN